MMDGHSVKSNSSPTDDPQNAVGSPPSHARVGLYRRLFARFYDRFMSGYERKMTPRKEALFSGLSGTVVEIGAGTGKNLEFMPSGCRWIGIEPNAYMHEAAQRRARDLGIDMQLQLATAEGFDLPDATADTVISTLVLCSVDDVSRVLQEVRRVLRPGGRFLFIEHVAAPEGSGLWRLQRGLAPCWSWFGDGCRIDRDTGAAIHSAGFAHVEMESFRLSQAPSWVSPHILGRAVR